MELLEQIGQATAVVAERAGQAVVAIGRASRGSGVVVARDTVLTNAHNLRDRTTQVTFVDGRTAQATVAGVDVDGDLAVLTVTTEDVAPLEWGDPDGLTVGAAVFGLARRGTTLRTTFGTVSALDQAFRGPRGGRIDGAFEHTAPMGRGSSGGPVTDGDGRLLGVNTSRLGEGFYLAVPATAELRRRVDELARGESPRRARLGVGLAPSAVANRLRRMVGLPPRAGLLVQVVDGDGAAAAAGIEQGDLIVGVAGHEVERADDLLAALAELDEGGTLTLTVVRGVEERSVLVRFDGHGTQGSA